MATYTQACSQVGSFDYAKYFSLYVVLTDRDGNPSTNKSLVDYKAYCQSSGSGSISANHKLYFWLDGKVIRDENVYVDVKSPNAYIEIASGTLEIPHDNDGSRSISFSASINATGGYGVSASLSNNFPLNTIPRASSISCTTANIGENAVITINSASPNFRHNVWVVFGNQAVTAAQSYSGGTFQWTIPESFYEQIPNSKSGTGTMGCATYNGDTLIGEKTITITVTTNEEKCRPSISATVIDVNETTKNLTGNNTKLIKYKSDAKVDIVVEAKNSATISTKKINNTTISGTTLTINKIETDTFVATVVDSRGYSNSVILEPTVIPYIPLSINANIKRTQPTTGEVGITFTGNYYNGSLGTTNNSLSIAWKYKESGTSEWINGGNITPVVKNNTYSNCNITISLGKIFDYQKSYDFMLVVNDKLTTLQPTYIVTQGIPIFNWGKDFVNINGNLFINNVLLEEKMQELINGTQIVVSETLPNSINTSVVIKYPEGFTIDNSYVLCCKIYYDAENRRVEPSWIDIYMHTTGISVTAKNELACNKEVQVFLKKYSE